MLNQVKDYLLNLQGNICDSLAEEDGKKKFMVDTWKSAAMKGGGITRVMENGAVFERGGVNFSHVTGTTLPPAATLKRPELAGKGFQAVGISLIMHPNNPFVPTTHANLRFFIAGDKNPVWWFGGGYDLTPFYGFDEDCIHWHQTAKAACDPFGTDLYPHYKKWADDYFYLKHRKECRGIGGLFFDDVNEQGFHQSFAFLKSIGDSFLDAYLPLVQKRKNTTFTQAQRDFQLMRRGRYVEFNLVYDRGTLFGLQSGGRTESILVSMPPHVNWQYCYQPKPNTPEAKLTDYYLIPKNWVDL